MKTTYKICCSFLISLILIIVAAGCTASDAINEDVYFKTIYTWNGTAWNTVTGGGIGVETDPLWSASPSFGITALDIAGWDGHAALTTGIHGVGAGDVVGTTLVQELDNKTLDSSVGKGTWTASGTWKLPAMFFNGDITTDRWLSTAANTFLGVNVVGADALSHTAGYTGYKNTAIGYSALFSNTLGWSNEAFGENSLYSNTEGYNNVAFGSLSLQSNTIGNYNTAVGNSALTNNIGGLFNTAVGVFSSGNNTSGNYNTAIGMWSGYSNSIGSRNLYLGYKAGYYETGDDKLYIDNSDTLTPLIYGDFSANTLTLFGKVGINVNPPTAWLHLPAGTATAGTAPLKLTTGTLLTTPEAGVLEYDGTGIYLTNSNHRRFISQAADSIITSVSVNNTAVETTVYTAVLNANELKPYRVYRLNLYGEISTASAVDTLTMAVYINGTTLVTLTSGVGAVDADPVHAQVVFTVRAIGGAGEISAHCDMEMGDASTHVNETSIVLDTTIINNITVSFQWSVAKVDNIADLDQAFLEVLD